MSCAVAADSMSSPSSSSTSLSSPDATSSSRCLADDTAEPLTRSAPPAKEQKKRGRVTPEQLVVLEALFADNHSPNAILRKEISGQLGMAERQTQIWFQNRRAKEKQGKGKKPGAKEKPTASTQESPPAPPLQPPSIVLFPSQDAEIQTRIREDDPVIVIPCTQLSIGTWVRVAATDGDASQRHDLLAYICDAQNRLTWFVHHRDEAVEHAVRMDIALDSVVDATLAPTSPSASPISSVSSSAETSSSNDDQASRLTLLLAYSPLFFMTVTPPDGGVPVWAPCGDWTEGLQASVVLRHELLGACAPLTYLWTRLRTGPARAPWGSPYQPTLPHPHMPSSPTTALPVGAPPSPPIRELSDLSMEQQFQSPASSRPGSVYDPSYLPAYAPQTATRFATIRLPVSLASLRTAPPMGQLATPSTSSYSSMSSPLSPLFVQTPSAYSEDAGQECQREYMGAHGAEYNEYDEYLKVDFNEQSPGFAHAFPSPTPFSDGAGQDMFLPPSLSRRLSAPVMPMSVPQPERQLERAQGTQGLAYHHSALARTFLPGHTRNRCGDAPRAQRRSVDSSTGSSPAAGQGQPGISQGQRRD
ncbi:uncharacterized protein PHACADRAFT_182311 [Phanerochaete carnosa HHB-10118-sp]|uniref:Homeobox domain-containing protein n=1 Tax=Phanerochaete carnosa (strain HHB-10118-sp) TaxID=650164 RepID=K5V5G5_PHACS|nr:uncharacterized protein PHACADRAFT_182311 [Phanerochaete carnosa HHB-10118-sp]EKM57881.1 hypothetical protein PHACADRAFT_182311 [Phanerochaete carnosa HHB-10118-sp]